MFNIGDRVWYARTKSWAKYLPCPHCFGKKFLTVILGDDSQVTIDCDCCTRGYLGSQGVIEISEWRADVCEVIINRIQIKEKSIEYGFDGNYFDNNNRLFVTKEEAEKRVVELIEEHRLEEIKNFNHKTKLNKNWAWHVRYHRGMIKDAEKNIAYHTAKLNVAKIKSKEPDL